MDELFARCVSCISDSTSSSNDRLIVSGDFVEVFVVSGANVKVSPCNIPIARARCQNPAYRLTRSVGLPLKHWLHLLLAFYSHLTLYIDKEGNRHPEYLWIDRTGFKGESRVEEAEIDTVLRLISSTPEELERALQVRLGRMG